MKKSIGKSTLIMVLVVMLSMLMCTTAFAHGVLSEDTEPGVVHFYYDDKSPMAKAFVTVYDTEGNEIATGETDKNGLFDYSSYENVGMISAGEPSGHHIDHTIGDGIVENTTAASSETEKAKSSNNTVVIVVVLAVIVIAAVVFSVINKKKKS